MFGKIWIVDCGINWGRPRPRCSPNYPTIIKRGRSRIYVTSRLLIRQIVYMVYGVMGLWDSGFMDDMDFVRFLEVAIQHPRLEIIQLAQTMDDFDSQWKFIQYRMKKIK